MHGIMVENRQERDENGRNICIDIIAYTLCKEPFVGATAQVIRFLHFIFIRPHTFSFVFWVPNVRTIHVQLLCDAGQGCVVYRYRTECQSQEEYPRFSGLHFDVSF